MAIPPTVANAGIMFGAGAALGGTLTTIGVGLSHADLRNPLTKPRYGFQDVSQPKPQMGPSEAEMTARAMGVAGAFGGVLATGAAWKSLGVPVSLALGAGVAAGSLATGMGFSLLAKNR